MKSTIDLTIDRDFPDRVYKHPEFVRNNNKIKSIHIIDCIVPSRLPWEPKCINLDSDFKIDGLFATGSVKDIKSRIEYEKCISTMYCDRCGSKTLTPWRWDSSLCENCSKELAKSLTSNKLPWE